VLHTRPNLLASTQSLAGPERIVDISHAPDLLAAQSAGCDLVIVAAAAVARAAQAMSLRHLLIPTRGTIPAPLLFNGQEPSESIAIPAPLQKAA
jgi:hypothetical protein